jgi:hypothetical protein
VRGRGPSEGRGNHAAVAGANSVEGGEKLFQCFRESRLEQTSKCISAHFGGNSSTSRPDCSRKRITTAVLTAQKLARKKHDYRPLASTYVAAHTRRLAKKTWEVKYHRALASRHKTNAAAVRPVMQSRTNQ